MRWPTYTIVAIAAAALISGWLFLPEITFITGLAFALLLLVLYSGAEDPNPMRTSILLHRGIPDRPLVHRAFMPIKTQKNPNPLRTFFLTLIATCVLLIAVGAYWIMF